MRAKSDDKTFVELFEKYGGTETARRIGTTERNVFARRVRIERRLGRALVSPRDQNAVKVGRGPHRVEISVTNGIVLVGSDAHIWPGPKSTAMRAFIKFCKEYQPAAVILNGDVVDLPQVSRHPPIGWENHPTVQQEIEAAQNILHEIELAAFKARKVWTLGNHDQRYETRLASVAPEYAKLNGFHLKDFFPNWENGWSVQINSDCIVKHRYKGGMGATRANALNAGTSMITGHLHSANVRGVTDYRGTRWGVDTGCLADPSHSAFVDYTEDAPLDWRSGFGFLTFRDGVLLQPELVLTHSEGVVDFRGQLHEV